MKTSFRLGSHELAFKQGDITREEADAIVNAANSMLLGGGGVDGAIHRAAGPELLEVCRQVKKSLPGGLLRTGEAVATPAFKLKAQAIIHCVGPSYGQNGEGVWPMLESCYRRALALCRENGFRSVAFPSISTGAYGCPVRKASEVALTAIRDDLQTHGGPQVVTFVLFDVSTLGTYRATAERLFDAAATAPP